MALSAHHASARKIVLQVDRLLDELESGRDTSVSMQSTISQHLNTLARELDALERLLPELALQERNMWRKKISQLQEQTNSQRASLSKFSSKLQQRMRDAEERAALLQASHVHAKACLRPAAANHAAPVKANARGPATAAALGRARQTAITPSA